MTRDRFEPAEPTAAAADLAMDAAHVWLLPLDLPEEDRDAMLPLLDAAQHRRAAAFAFDHLRARYVAAHGQMRRILSAYTGAPANALPLRTTAEGKPYLWAGDTPAFNLSHSDGLGLLGVARSAPVGADIERIRPSPDLQGIADTTFSPDERAALARLTASRHTEGFFAGWTRKEAVIKADGRGLGVPLASFTVTIDPETPPDVTFAPGVFKPGFALKLFDIPAPDGYRAAIAVSPIVGTLRFFRLPAGNGDG